MVILTLALGIGSTTVTSSVVNAVLLRPLSYHKSDRLVSIRVVESTTSLEQRASYPDFLDWQADSRTLELVGYSGIEAILTGAGEPQRLMAALTIGNVFALLGVDPMLGTTANAEGRNRPEPLVVLSYGMWRRSFNADPNVLGQHVTLNGLSHTVSAVMPPHFQFPIQPANPVDLWVPLERFNPALTARRGARLIDVIWRPRAPLTVDLLLLGGLGERCRATKGCGVRSLLKLSSLFGLIPLGIGMPGEGDEGRGYGQNREPESRKHCVAKRFLLSNQP